MIVNTKLACDSKKTALYLQLLAREYPFLQVETIGESLFGSPILAARVGEGETGCLAVGAHHGLEWITTLVLLRFVEDLCRCCQNEQPLLDYRPADMLRTRSFWVVPMLNPDGVDIALRRIPTDRLREITRLCPYEELPFRWQANGRGVDLNHNYDACWEEGKRLEPQYGIEGPGPTRFGGPASFSEPESRALACFTSRVQPRLVLAYHSQGEVIYYQFGQKTPRVSHQMVELLCGVSGYQKDDTIGIAACRGYKDWFIKQFHRPGFTVEVGQGQNPLPLEQFPIIYRKNLPLLLLAGLL
ncbi:MAG: M14 family metallopeptidase [Eubacteriales bacterium]|jgi:g-D-glutamyl-meso-diaminopimelate peptidase